MINIRYAQIRSLDLSNGKGIGVALFVQGCNFHCKNCFNPETWDFNGGKEWTWEVKNRFLELANRPYIKRISILGGEPLADENIDGVLDLVNRIRLSCPQKSIWIYSGYTWEEIYEPYFTDQSQEWIENYLKLCEIRKKIISQCDVLIDGRYADSQRNVSLPWRDSENQQIIDIKKTIQQGEIVLWQT